MKIETLNGARIVKRYRNGRCYAAAFSGDTTDRQIKSAMMQGEAAFFPFNETKGTFNWKAGTGRPLHIKR